MTVQVDNTRRCHILNHLRILALVLHRDLTDDVRCVLTIDLQILSLLEEQVHGVVTWLDRADLFGGLGGRG